MGWPLLTNASWLHHVQVSVARKYLQVAAASPRAALLILINRRLTHISHQ